jgi:hypothetical protein
LLPHGRKKKKETKSREIDNSSFMSWSPKSDKYGTQEAEKFIHNVVHNLIATAVCGKYEMAEIFLLLLVRLVEFNDF